MPRPYPGPIPDPPQPPLEERLRALALEYAAKVRAARLQYEAESLAPYLDRLDRPPAAPAIARVRFLGPNQDKTMLRFAVDASPPEDGVTSRPLKIVANSEPVLGVDLLTSNEIVVPENADIVLTLKDIRGTAESPESQPFTFKAVKGGGGDLPPAQPTILGVRFLGEV